VRRLEDLSRRIFSRGNARMSFTGTEADLERWQKAAGGLALGSAAGEPRLVLPEPRVRNEAFVMPGNVCFVGETLDAKAQGMRLSGPWMVANRVLSFSYLWNEVRVKGGAYGCGFRSSDDAMLQFYSYRDPGVDATLAAYAGAASWLAGWQPDRDEFEGFVISTVSGFDTPRKPREIARQQDILRIIGRPAGWREQLRSESLSCDVDALHDVAETLEAAQPERAVCVFGGKGPIEASALDLEVHELMGGDDLAAEA
jgi:Zn-dependent M16 (insulinase) family peptidase